jgi:hypothetical protein
MVESDCGQAQIRLKISTYGNQSDALDNILRKLVECFIFFQL